MYFVGKLTVIIRLIESEIHWNRSENINVMLNKISIPQW